MENRKKILRKSKRYIYTESNPSKRNLYDPAKDDFVEVSSIEDILISLQMSTSWCKAALSISDGMLIFGRIHALEANLDVQPVSNHYKTVT